MGNTLNMPLEGKVVVLKESALKPEYGDVKWRLFRVDGGFGATPGTLGNALIGQFVADGENARMEGFMVERLATENDMPACHECGAEALVMCDEFCSSRWV